jgi:Uma2 family endonuclease
MATTKATVDDVLRLGAEGKRYELIDGELVEMSPTGLEHGRVEIWAGSVIARHAAPRHLGEVFGGEPLFRLDSAAGLARAPDLAFVRRDRLVGRDLTGAFDGAPDLAVEIVSPSDSLKDLEEKAEQWLAYGARAVLVMHPNSRSVVLRTGEGARHLSGDDQLDLDPALPGFRCTVSDLSPPPLGDEPTQPA